MDGISSTENQETGGAYRVLARKYRPRTFDELIGQEPMVRTLANAFAAGRIAQAWMLTGVRGVGKTTTARILARALNYTRDDVADGPAIEMPELGDNCEAIMEGRHVDVIEMDAASHTSINDIREIIEQIRYRPVSARYKVYIIDEVHMLSTAAFNGLLKTLEEPPEHVKFVFATTEIRKVPVTVLSRCQRFDLRRIDADTLVAHLAKIAKAEEVTVEDEALALIARAAEGSVRDALSLLDQAIAHSGGTIATEDVRDMLGLADRARIIDLFEKVMSGDVTAAIGELGAQYEVGADPAVVLTDLAEFVHLVTRLRFAPDAVGGSITEAERTRGTTFAETLSVRVLSRTWQMLLKGIQEVQTAPKPLAAAEMVLVRLCFAADLPTPDEALKLLRDSTIPAGRTTGTGHSAAAPAAPQASARQHDPTPPTGARLSIAGGSGETMDSLIGSAPERRETPADEPAVVIASLDDIVELAAGRRDLKLKELIETFVRPVRLEPGRMEIALEAGAPSSLPGDLSARLKEWTGSRWIVTVARDGGGATIRQKRQTEKQRLTDEARKDPNVEAVLDAFPGAEIVGVRINTPERTDAAEQDETGDAEQPEDGNTNK